MNEGDVDVDASPSPSFAVVFSNPPDSPQNVLQEARASGDL